MKPLRLYMLLSSMLIVSCSDRKEPKESQEEMEDREASAGIWMFGNTKWIHIASTRSTDPDGDNRVAFIEAKLEAAHIRFLTNGSLGVQGISVPLADKDNAIKLLSGHLDSIGKILPVPK